MTTARKKLIDRLLTQDCGELFDQFVIVGLEYGLELILEGIEELLAKDHLKDHQWQDLVDSCYDAKAFVRVLRYHNTHTYDKEMIVINKGFDKQREWI